MLNPSTATELGPTPGAPEAMSLKPVLAPQRNLTLQTEARRKVSDFLGWADAHEPLLSAVFSPPPHLALSAALERERVLDGMHGIVHDAARLDQQATQGAFLDLAVDKNASALAQMLGDIAFGFPEMASSDQPVTTDSQTGLSFVQFYDRKIFLPNGTDAATAIELLCGLASLLEDPSGRPVELLFLNLLEAKPSSQTSKIPDKQTTGVVCKTPEDFNRNYYYGLPVPMDDIQDMIHDSVFQQELNQLLGRELNPSVIPLYAKVRLRNLLQSQENTQAVRRFVSAYGAESFSLFQLLDQNDIISAIDMITYLDTAYTQQSGQSSGYGSRILRNATFVSEFAPGLAGGMDKHSLEIMRLLEIKIKQQLLETCAVYPQLRAKRDDLMKKLEPGQEPHPGDRNELETDLDQLEYDWEMISYSMEMTGMTAQAAQALAQNKEFPFDFARMQMPPRFLLDGFRFSQRHPTAKTIYQTLFDFTTAVFIARQDEADYHGKIPTMKSDFYNAFTQMYETSPTTSSRDIDRTYSLINQYVHEHPQLTQSGISILLGGCGTCERFEAPLLRMMDAKGIKTTRRIGVDLTDTSDKIPADVGIEFVQADFLDEKFSLQQPVDVLILPWSMINDFVEKRGLMEALQRIRTFVKDDGLIIFDVPLPVGDHSYAKTIEQQADQWRIWGLMERDFQQGDHSVSSLFDIMHVKELTMHLLHAGLIPNLPLEFDELAKLCTDIENDDSPLNRRQQSGEDRDAARFPVWQANGWNRVTIAARKSSLLDIFHRTGLSPSILAQRLSAVSGTRNPKERLETLC